MRRIPGSCALTDRMVFDVVTTWPEGHPFERQPHKLGPPLPEARRVTLVLVNGSIMQVTVHEDQVTKIADDLPGLHGKIVAGLMWQRENRPLDGAQPLNDAQSAHELETILQISRNVPLGVLCVETWTDLVRAR